MLHGRIHSYSEGLLLEDCSVCCKREDVFVIGLLQKAMWLRRRRHAAHLEMLLQAIWKAARLAGRHCLAQVLHIWVLD